MKFVHMLMGAALLLVGCASGPVAWKIETPDLVPEGVVIVRGEVRGYQAEVPFRRARTLGRAIAAAAGNAEYIMGVRVVRDQAAVLDVRDRRSLQSSQVQTFPLRVGDVVILRRMLD